MKLGKYIKFYGVDCFQAFYWFRRMLEEHCTIFKHEFTKTLNTHVQDTLKSNTYIIQKKLFIFA